jgi:hypothetical protein
VTANHRASELTTRASVARVKAPPAARWAFREERKASATLITIACADDDGSASVRDGRSVAAACRGCRAAKRQREGEKADARAALMAMAAFADGDSASRVPGVSRAGSAAAAAQAGTRIGHQRRATAVVSSLGVLSALRRPRRLPSCRASRWANAVVSSLGVLSALRRPRRLPSCRASRWANAVVSSLGVFSALRRPRRVSSCRVSKLTRVPAARAERST